MKHMYLCSFICLISVRAGALWLCWGSSLVVASGRCFPVRCAGFSSRLCCGSTAGRRRGPRAHLPQGVWDLPRPGIGPASPALAGGFSATAPPGKPKNEAG